MNKQDSSTGKFIRSTIFTVPIIMSLRTSPTYAASGSNRGGGGSSSETGTSSGGGTQVSDRRLKKDIDFLTTLKNGIRLYSFKYTWSNDYTYVGVMAQDLLLSPLYEDAVSLEDNGFYSVNYDRLGLQMVTLNEWQHCSQSIYTKASLTDEVAA